MKNFIRYQVGLGLVVLWVGAWNGSAQAEMVEFSRPEGVLRVWKDSHLFWLIPDRTETVMVKNSGFVTARTCASFDRRVSQVDADLRRCLTEPRSPICEAAREELDDARYMRDELAGGKVESTYRIGKINPFLPTFSEKQLRELRTRILPEQNWVTPWQIEPRGIALSDVEFVFLEGSRSKLYKTQYGIQGAQPAFQDQIFRFNGVEIACDLLEGKVSFVWKTKAKMQGDQFRTTPLEVLYPLYEQVLSQEWPEYDSVVTTAFMTGVQLSNGLRDLETQGSKKLPEGQYYDLVQDLFAFAFDPSTSRLVQDKMSSSEMKDAYYLAKTSEVPIEIRGIVKAGN